MNTMRRRFRFLKVAFKTITFYITFESFIVIRYQILATDFNICSGMICKDHLTGSSWHHFFTLFSYLQAFVNPRYNLYINLKVLINLSSCFNYVQPDPSFHFSSQLARCFLWLKSCVFHSWAISFLFIDF